MTYEEALKIFRTSYDPSRYALLSEFEIEDWSVALEHRGDLFALERHLPRDEFKSRVLNLIAKPVWRASTTNEWVYDGAVQDITVYAAWCLKDEVEKDPTMRAACELEDDPPPPPPSAYEEGSEEWWIESLEKSRDADRTRRLSVAHESYNDHFIDVEGNYAYISVQLDAPDNVIVEHFKEWLSRSRSKEGFPQGPQKKFTEAELGRWRQNRVLQYIDLRLLSRAIQFSPTQAMYGAVLFSDQLVDGAEKIRKTVEGLAETLLDWTTIEALRAAVNAKKLRNRKIS